MRINKTSYKSTTIDDYNTIIDVRTPLEFVEDHIPRSVNYPVLTNKQRHEIGLKYNMIDLNRKELLTEDLLFTKVGWIYQYNAIPNNTDNQWTNHFMKKTYEHFYGELND